MNKYNRITEKGLPIYQGEHRIGEVMGDVFYKKIRFSRHALRHPPALALSIESLDAAERAGAEWVEIIDSESKTKYRASLEHIREKGIPIQRGPFEPQLALPLTGWIIHRPGEPEQLSLFTRRVHA